MLLCCPEVLSMRQRDLDSTVRVLRDKCLFTAQQVTEILHRCPFVLREDPSDLEYKFQVSSRLRVGARWAPWCSGSACGGGASESSSLSLCHCGGSADPEGARLVLGVPMPVFEVSGQKVANTFFLEPV